MVFYEDTWANLIKVQLNTIHVIVCLGLFRNERSKRQSLAAYIFVIRALSSRNNLSTGSKGNGFFFFSSPHLPTYEHGTSVLSSGWVWATPTFLLASEEDESSPALCSPFVAEMELNGSHGEAGRLLSVIPTSVKQPPGRTSLFRETWQGRARNVFEQTGSLAQQKSE